MDTFIEKIVARKKTSKDMMFNIGIILAGLILFFALQMVPFLSSFFLLILVGVIYGAYQLIKSRNIEFEYVVTNGDLDIDKIIAQRKRKRIFSASCKEFDIVAKVKSSHYGHHVETIKNRFEAVSSMDSDNVFFATLNYKGEKTVVFFEPDERMLNNFKTFIPRKIFVN